MFTSAILKRGRVRVKGMVGVFFLSGAVLLFSGCAENAPTENTVSLTVEGDQPTPIRFEGQPTPVLLPHTNLYIFLTSSRPLYFRNGKYFQFYRDHWYRSEDMKGPWEQIDDEEIPDLLHSVPPDYYYDNFPYKVRKNNE